MHQIYTATSTTACALQTHTKQHVIRNVLIVKKRRQLVTRRDARNRAEPLVSSRCKQVVGSGLRQVRDTDAQHARATLQGSEQRHTSNGFVDTQDQET